MTARRIPIWRLTAVGLILFLAIQLVPVERENPPVRAEILAPDEVLGVLESSCYDCHSNKTRWPWYSRVVPFSLYVAEHVRVGRSELNFSEWPAFDADSQQFLFGEIRKQLEAETMPLDSYLWLHWDARLSDEERGLLLDWIDEELMFLSAD